MPDDIFAKEAAVVWIEFKVPGRNLTDGQEEEHEEMRKAGLNPKVCWTLDTFKNLLNDEDPTLRWLDEAA